MKKDVKNMKGREGRGGRRERKEGMKGKKCGSVWREEREGEMMYCIKIQKLKCKIKFSCLVLQFYSLSVVTAF